MISDANDSLSMHLVWCQLGFQAEWDALGRRVHMLNVVYDLGEVQKFAFF